MRRRLFNSTAAVSLMLLLVIVGLWVRSYGVGDRVLSHDGLNGYHCLKSAGGEIGYVYLGYETDWYPPFHTLIEPAALTAQMRESAALSNGGGWSGLGFTFAFKPQDFGLTPLLPRRAFGVPDWFLALAFAIGPILWLRSRRRANTGSKCAFCGYSLTGNTSGICPECGTPVAANEQVKAD